MQAYAYYGRLGAPSPFCSFTKTFMEEGIERYLDWMLKKQAKDGSPPR